jgi:hypothetical protein
VRTEDTSIKAVRAIYSDHLCHVFKAALQTRAFKTARAELFFSGAAAAGLEASDMLLLMRDRGEIIVTGNGFSLHG